MNTEHLRKIYSRHGLNNLAKTIDVLTGLDDIILDVFNQDETSQERFFQGITEVLKTYKTKVHL